MIFSEPGDQKTEILYGSEDAVGQGIRFMQNTREKMDIYFDRSGPSIVIEVDAYRKGYEDIRRRGGRIRALTEITPENIRYCKELMKLVDELYHVDGLKGGVAVNEGEYMSTTVLEEGRPLTQVIYSNVKALTEQAQYIFVTLLNNSVPAEQRIRELEEGIMPEVIETMRETDRTQKLAFDLIKSARREVLIIFSTANAFHRQVRAVTVPLVRDLAEKYNVRVKIMTPVDDRIEALARNLSKEGRGGILLRYMEPSLQGVSILIVDRKVFAGSRTEGRFQGEHP